MDAADSASTTPSYVRRLMRTVAHLFVPAPLRQNPRSVCTTIGNEIGQYPEMYRYVVLAIAVTLGLAEWQQPGFLPNADEFTAALVGFLCAGFLIFSAVVLQDFTETHRWPWHEDGGVWPWEALLWEGTVYGDDFRDSTASFKDTTMSPPAQTHTSNEDDSTRKIRFSSPKTGKLNSTEVRKIGGDSKSSPQAPALAYQTPFVIPPTPQLPLGLRPVHLPPPKHAQVHKSGLLGESPMAPKR